LRRDLDIRLLRTLVTIVETGGFRRAADTLNMSQPAVSQHVRRLEGLIGGSVFQETGRSMRLSSGGEELLQYARRMVRLNDELVLRLAGGRSGHRVAIGVCDTLSWALPGLLSRISEQHPQSTLTVRTGDTAWLAEQVATGTLDAALLLDAPDSTRDLCVGHLACAWFGQPALLAEESLPIATVSEPYRLRRMTEELLEAVDRPWRVTYEGVGLEGVAAANRSGLGVSLLFAGAEAVWGLRPLLPASLADPDRSLPVTLRVAAHVGEALVCSLLRALSDALHDLPVEFRAMKAVIGDVLELTPRSAA
jgi:DNA-binding transcriptional LysR family regulator